MLRFATLTDVGCRRVNEDNLGCFQNGPAYCFVLCDGLGGHGMGDIASGLAVEVFGNLFSKMTKEDQFLPDAFSAAQDIIMAEQICYKAQQKMKSTAVAMVTDGKKAYIGHVGDSRLYVFKGGQVQCRTLDHSIPQMLVLTHEIEESEIRHHKSRNIVLRVLGIDWEEPMYELMKPLKLKGCQAFLLCSDGFWELIEEEDMCRLLASSTSPEQWLAQMEQVVRANGAGTNMDNYSAIAVWNG